MNDDRRAPIETRTASLAQVDYADRVIELIAVPYDEWAPVEIAGRLVEESFSPGAFEGVQHRVGRARFQVNIGHDPDQWVGRVIGLDTAEPRGLRAELKIRRGTEAGRDFDQVLYDAADGMYAASVGFAPLLNGGEQWTEQRSRRRILRAYLDHIALTPTPAYAGADVISVRVAPPKSATPNLDKILAERRAAVYGDG